MKAKDVDYGVSVDELKGRVAVPRYYFDVLPKEIRELAFTVSDLESLRTINLIKKSLANAIEEGFSFDTWKTTLPKAALKGLSQARLENVYRTNIGVVYGQSTRYNAVTSDVTPYLMYSATGDDRTRESHMKLDGVVKRADSKFWDKYMPSWDYQCRCDAVPISEARAKEMGITKGTPIIDDDGFGVRKLGNVSGGVEKDLNKAIKSLDGEFKEKFEEAQTNRKSLVDIWFEKNKDIFNGL